MRVRQTGIKPTDKKLTIHVLEKNCIQNWADCLLMNVVQAFAGHSSIDTTARFYSTVDEIHMERAARATDELLATDHIPTISGEMTKI